MSTLSEESQVLESTEWKSIKLLNDASTDETTSDAVDIRNAKAVTLFVETGTGVNAGVVKLETAMNSAGPWFVAGSVTTAAASTGYSDTIGFGDAGLPAKYARARIETAIGVGTVDVYLCTQR